MQSETTLPLLPAGNIPLQGFGTYQLEGDACKKAVLQALEVGYRHIDTAHMYGNHEQVQQALSECGIPRDELFITSKVRRDELQTDQVIAAGRLAVKQLGLDSLDLFLVHWPNKDVPLQETLLGMRRLIDEGTIRACGVSNFTARRLAQALDLDIVPIANNQVEFHPFLNQKALHKFCVDQGLTLTAYSPLGRGKVNQDQLLIDLGQKYQRTPSQITLRWLFQKGIVAIPKASSREHQSANFHIADFELTPQDFAAIDDREVWEREVKWEVAEFED